MVVVVAEDVDQVGHFGQQQERPEDRDDRDGRANMAMESIAFSAAAAARGAGAACAAIGASVRPDSARAVSEFCMNFIVFLRIACRVGVSEGLGWLLLRDNQQLCVVRCAIVAGRPGGSINPCV